MNIMRMCFDWRVLTALGALGVGVFIVAPGLAAAALPLLILAACPLSMIFMMKSMGGQQAPTPDASPAGDGDRVGALRGELAELGRRQERLAAELTLVEATEARGGSEASDTVPASAAR